MTQASSPLPPLISSPPPTIPPTTETINSPTWSSDLSSEDGSSHFDLPSDLEWSDTDHHLIDPIQRAQLLSDIRELGPSRFLQKFESLPLRTILDNLGFCVPSSVELSQDQLLTLFDLAASRILRRREKLPQHNTLDDVVNLIQSSSKIVILTGAGVSTSCGIPDFRSPDGLYAQLRHQGYELDDPHQMFDLQYFTSNPQVFYSFAKHIFPSNFKPSPSHRFIKLLEHKSKLLRNYTQNIDTLETQAGVQNVIQCHGSFATATCLKCQASYAGSAIQADVLAGRVVLCTICNQKRPIEHEQEKTVPKPKKKKKKKSNDGEEGGWGPGSSEEKEEVAGDWISKGVVKPDITFFGEKLSSKFEEAIDQDRTMIDLLIVIGTSLKVSPVSELISLIPQDVPQILINREPIEHGVFDVCLLGDSDGIVHELCQRLGTDWNLFEEEITVKGQKRDIRRIGMSHVWLLEGAKEDHRWLEQWKKGVGVEVKEEEAAPDQT